MLKYSSRKVISLHRSCSVRSLSSDVSTSAAITRINEQIESLKVAQQEFLEFDQQKVDHIFQHVAHEASKKRVPLARMAVQETRMGAFEDLWAPASW